MDDQKKPRVLMVDDEEAILRMYHRVLKGDFEVVTAPSAAAGIMLLEQQTFDVIVTDFRMPHCNGIALLEVAKVRFPKVRRMLHTGTPPPDINHHIEAGTVERCMAKPVDAQQLTEAIKALCERKFP